MHCYCIKSHTKSHTKYSKNSRHVVVCNPREEVVSGGNCLDVDLHSVCSDTSSSREVVVLSGVLQGGGGGHPSGHSGSVAGGSSVPMHLGGLLTSPGNVAVGSLVVVEVGVSFMQQLGFASDGVNEVNGRRGGGSRKGWSRSCCRRLGGSWSWLQGRHWRKCWSCIRGSRNCSWLKGRRECWN